jgi:hypothetical protein
VVELARRDVGAAHTARAVAAMLHLVLVVVLKAKGCLLLLLLV